MDKGFGVLAESTFLQFQSKLCLCSWVGLKLFFPGKLYLATNISHLVLLISAVSFIFEFVILVTAYDCLDVLHAALIHFNIIFVEYLVEGVIFWEMDIY